MAWSQAQSLNRGDCRRPPCSRWTPGCRSPEEFLEGQFAHLNFSLSNCFGLKVSQSSTWLTPSQNAELEDIRGHVDVKYFDKRKIHVNGLQAHPGERRQEEVLQRGRYRHAEAMKTPRSQPGVDQKHQVQAQQCQGEVDEDLRGVVSTKLSDADMKREVRR